MKKLFWLLVGFSIGIIFFLLGIFLKKHMLFASIVGSLGLISLFLSGTSVGAFVSGDRVRANYWVESKQTREERMDFAIKMGLFGLPLILSAIGIYFIVYS